MLLSRHVHTEAAHHHQQSGQTFVKIKTWLQWITQRGRGVFIIWLWVYSVGFIRLWNCNHHPLHTPTWTQRQKADLCYKWSGREGDDVIRLVWNTAGRASLNPRVWSAFPMWAIFLSFIHTHFSHLMGPRRQTRGSDFIIYLLFVFLKFINNQDVTPPLIFPHGLDCMTVMHFNAVMVHCLTSPAGPVLSADSINWCHPATWLTWDQFSAFAWNKWSSLKCHQQENSKN